MSPLPGYSHNLSAADSSIAIPEEALFPGLRADLENLHTDSIAHRRTDALLHRCLPMPPMR